MRNPQVNFGFFAYPGSVPKLGTGVYPPLGQAGSPLVVPTVFAGQVERLVRQHYGHVELTGGHTVSQNDDWIAAAFRAVPRDQRPRLYRSLATVLHPDAGGSNEAMKRLNPVWERTRRSCS